MSRHDMIRALRWVRLYYLIFRPCLEDGPCVGLVPNLWISAHITICSEIQILESELTGIAISFQGRGVGKPDFIS